MTKIRRYQDRSDIRPLAILVAVIFLLYVAREIFVPFAFALTLSFILAPVVMLLQKARLGRIPAVLLVLIVTVSAALGVGWLMFNQLVEVANQLPAYSENVHNKIESMRAPSKGALARAARSMEDLGRELTSAATVPPSATGDRRQPLRPAAPLPVQVVPPANNGLAYLGDLVKPFLQPAGVTAIVLILTIFMLIEREDLRNRLLRLGGVAQLNLMTEALDDASQRISRYLFLQVLVNGAMGVTFGICLYFIGVPYAALWGVVAAILRTVPYVGIIAAALLPLSLSLAVFDGWLRPTLVFLLFAIVEIIVANFLEPLLYGAHTGISSLGLLLSTIFWTLLWGYAGLVLSTPLTVCVVVLGRYLPNLSFLKVLLADEPALALEAQLYQRLLAMDQVEARSVIDGFLKERTLGDLYDSVLIPMLILAEQDRHKGRLDIKREEFLFLSLTEIVAELGEARRESTEDPAQPALDSGPDAPVPTPTIVFPGRILSLAAKDEADEVVSGMLGQLLEEAGCAVVSLPLGSANELAFLEPTSEDVICISALPPFAFARAASLCAQFRARFPQVRILVGLWGMTGNTEPALRRLERFRAATLVTSLAQVMEQINGVPAPRAPVPTT